MEINNYEIIKPLLNFENPDQFYFVQVIQRKKDHSRRTVNGTNNNSRLVKAYYVDNLEYFEWIQPEIIELCKIFKARAGINLNRRSYKQSAFQTLRKIADQILNEDYDKVKKVYNTICGAYSKETDKNWLLDLDFFPTQEKFDYLLSDLEKLQPQGPKFIAQIPSRSGVHIVTKPFNVKEFNNLPVWKDIEIHKNNPVNLYIPEL